MLTGFAFLCISCQSTKIYESYDDSIYSGTELIFQKTKDIDQDEPVILCNKTDYEDNGLTRYTEKCKITCDNTTDFKLIAYSFFLKPVIVVFMAAAESVKCIAWATASFARVFWFKVSGAANSSDPNLGYKYGEKILPKRRAESVIEKRKRAESEKVLYPVYEKYRKAFHKSHIIVENTLIETSNYKTENEIERIVSYERLEYVNGILVSKNIKSDFYKTIYYSDFICWFVAFPISIVSGFAGYVLASIL